jgi:chemotaxis protein CheX
MKMQLIQPFISAADSVLASALHGPTKIGDLSMEQEDYRPKGCAARIAIHGEIEGRLIVDMTRDTAVRVACALAGEEVEESDQVIGETVFELANMMIGNAVTLLNDHGYQFKVFPPETVVNEENSGGKTETEETAIYFDTACGRVFLNIWMRYNLRPRADHVPALSS